MFDKIKKYCYENRAQVTKTLDLVIAFELGVAAVIVAGAISQKMNPGTLYYPVKFRSDITGTITNALVTGHQLELMKVGRAIAENVLANASTIVELAAKL